MAAPRDILDSLESVIGVYFSGVRNPMRAAFILCDGLVELSCKAKAETGGWRPAQINFIPLLQLPQVNLDPANGGIGHKVNETHKVRNKMHHVNAVAAVDHQHCADAIIDAVECIEHCFPGAKAAFDDKLKVALRVVRLYSALGSGQHRMDFEREMSNHNWRSNDRKPKTNEMIVTVGLRPQWGLVIMNSVAVIETILISIGAP